MGLRVWFDIDRVQLCLAYTGGENNSLLSIDFVSHKDASLSLLSDGKQPTNAHNLCEM